MIFNPRIYNFNKIYCKQVHSGNQVHNQVHCAEMYIKQFQYSRIINSVRQGTKVQFQFEQLHCKNQTNHNK